MAAKVMAMPDSATQWQTMPEEEEDTLQTKPQLQRETMSEEDDKEEPVQAKPENSKFKIQNLCSCKPKAPPLKFPLTLTANSPNTTAAVNPSPTKPPPLWNPASVQTLVMCRYMKRRI